MDLSQLKKVSNSYHDVRLLSLHTWKRAVEFEDRDHAGPYVITQLAYDPLDTRMEPTDFLLGKTGEWVPLSVFFKLPQPVREEFFFSQASQVMRLMTDLPAEVRVIRTGKELDELRVESADELNAAVRKAVDEQKTSFSEAESGRGGG